MPTLLFTWGALGGGGWIVWRRLIHNFSLLARIVSDRVPRDSVPCKVMSVVGVPFIVESNVEK